MGESNQNHALVMLMFMSRLVEKSHLGFSNENAKVVMLDTYASSFFACGRDIENQPFVGVPSKMVPFFTQIDWVEASICRPLGYIFLEARDQATQSLNMAFGIKLRRDRLDVFCIEGHERVEDLFLNIKVFEQDLKNPKEVLFAEQHELVNITLKEINSINELGTEFDAKQSLGILKLNGLEQSFTPVKIKM